MANKTARFIAGKGGLTVKTVNVVTTQNAAPGQPYPTITQDQTDTRSIPSFQDSQSTVAGLKTFYVPGYVSPNDTAPVLTLPSGTQTGQTTATLSVTTDHTGGTLYTVVSTSATPPTAAQIKAGQDQSGSAAPYASSNASPVSGANTFSATGLTANTTYYTYFLHHDSFGLDSTVAAASSFTTLVNPATLSLPTLVATGTTTETAGATTDTAGGTLYFVVTTNSSTPTAAQIIAGHDSTGGAPAFAGSLTPNSGINTISATGLAAGTAYYNFAAQSSTGGSSNVVGVGPVSTNVATATLDGVHTNATLSNGNLTATHSNSSTGGARSTKSLSGSGKYYWEVTLTTINDTNSCVGIAFTTASFTDMINANTNVSIVFQTTGVIYSGGSSSGKTLGDLANGNIIGIALDFTNNKIWFRKAPSGNWNGLAIGSENPATNTGGVAINTNASNPALAFHGTSAETFTVNFGASAFSGTVPSGFTSGVPA